MKALEQALKYHFWILLGLGLILALVGWWMTTGSMQAATATARGELAAADKNKDVKDVPSDDYTRNLKAINAEQKALVDRTWAALFAKQKEKMVWPEIVAEAASNRKYRESFEDVTLRTVYRDNYYKEVDRVYQIPRPIHDATDSGIVHFPLAALPHIEWGDLLPTSQQMWDSMEDLWLLEPILEAVYETNGGENAKRHEAVVVAIEYLGLFGGDRSKIGQPEGQQGGGGGTEGGAKGAGGMVAGPSMNMPVAGEAKSGGLMSGAGGSSTQSISTDIKEVEEFGDPGSANRGGGGASPGSPGSAPGGGTSGGSTSGGSEGPRRYIDDDQTKSFRTRGFKLTVAMDHRRVPDLYAHLTSSESSPWPVQILRMNVARLSESGAYSGSTGGGGRKERRSSGGAFGGGGGGGLVGGGNQPGADVGNSPSASDELVNPFLARVTVVGLITLYNEPPITESAAGTTAGTTTTTTTQPATNDLPAEPKAREPATTSTEESASKEPEPALPAEDAEKDDPEKTEAPVEDAAPQDDPAGEGEPDESKPTDKTEDTPAASEPGTESPRDEDAPEPK